MRSQIWTRSMLNWILVICVAFTGLTWGSTEGEIDQEWPPKDVRYKTPIGFFWPHNPEKENTFVCVNCWKLLRTLTIQALMEKGDTKEKAVERYCDAPFLMQGIMLMDGVEPSISNEIFQCCPSYYESTPRIIKK